MAPTGRAYWKGYLRLSLVSIPVEIYSAEDRRSDLHLNQIHKPSGKRINYTKTVKGLGPVSPDDIVSGYEIDDDVYVVLEPDEIAAIKLESKRTVELSRFVPANDIDLRYFEEPYYIVPADEYAVEGYRVMHKALLDAKKRGIGQLTHGGREHLVAVAPLDDGLMLHRLRYENELKSPETFFEGIPDAKVDPKMVAIAIELIARNAGPFEPEAFSDRYVVELRKLIDLKAKGERIVTAPEPEASAGNVIDLMDALRRSLSKERPRQAAKKAPARRPRAKAGKTAKRARGS